jgi:tripartite-type tricarboxylate transporter receptor subunit TctC
MMGRGSKKLVWLTLAVGLTCFLASSVNAQGLKPLPDGFPKRAITIINIDDAGTRDGIYARMFQAACKGISPVPILVSDEPIAQGGTWMKLNELKKRPGATEGYYPAIFDVFGATTDFLVEPLTKDIKASVDDAKMVLVTELLAYFMIQRKDAPWGKSFEGLMKYAKEHPGRLKYAATDVGGGHDLAVGWILNRYGVTVNKIPQGSHQECASAVGAGAVDFSMIDGDIAFPNWQTGHIDVIMILADTVPSPFDKDPNVVSGKQLGLPSIVGTQLGLGVNSETPDSHVDWLYQLFYTASQKPEFQKRWHGLLPSDTPLPMKGPEVMKMMKQILVEFEQPVRDVGMHIDQQVRKK